MRPWAGLILALLLVAAVPLTGVARDTDGDGLRDAFERKSGLTSPRLADTDGDGVIDAAEDIDGDDLSALGEQRFGTDPAEPDSDGDGTPDGAEDHDGDGRSNALQQHARRVPTDLRPRLGRAADDIAKQARRCGVRAGEAEPNTCHFGDRDSDATIVLMGDSKATMYLPPAIAAAEAEGWHLTTLLKGRCTPIRGTMPQYQRVLDDGDSCRRWRRAAYELLNEDPPDLIVLVFSDDYGLVDGDGRRVTGKRKVRALSKGLAATVGELPASSTVALLADAPRQTLNPVGCLRRDPSDMSACVTPRIPVAAERMDQALRMAVLEAGGRYLTLVDRICPFQPCPLTQGDVLIYRDQGHLTVTFTRRLAPSLRAELAPLLEPSAEPDQGASDAAPDATVDPSLSPLPSPAPSEVAA